jgi:hypothetical protein
LTPLAFLLSFSFLVYQIPQGQYIAIAVAVGIFGVLRRCGLATIVLTKKANIFFFQAPFGPLGLFIYNP